VIKELAVLGIIYITRKSGNKLQSPVLDMDDKTSFSV
jgi:hypothetical protein